MSQDIWVIVQHREKVLDDSGLALINEGRRIRRESNAKGTITAVIFGTGLKEEFYRLEEAGVNKIVYIKDESLEHYHGELFAEVLTRMVKKECPSWILMVQSSQSADLVPRLAAILDSTVITRAVDCRIDHQGYVTAIRPVTNGYLSQQIRISMNSPIIIGFQPDVLNKPKSVATTKAEIIFEELGDEINIPATSFLQTIDTDPEDLNLEEVEIIIAGGRGVNKNLGFEVIHDLAKSLVGRVGATRPVIDCGTLSPDHQIGQTGKTVSPRLIINCGISGALEYTAGMDGSQYVIAINKDPLARIFQFVDIGIVGDLNHILPLLLAKIKSFNNF